MKNAKYMLTAIVIQFIIIVLLLHYIISNGSPLLEELEDSSRDEKTEITSEMEDSIDEQVLLELEVLKEKIKDKTEELNNCKKEHDEYLKINSEVNQQFRVDKSNTEIINQKYNELLYRFKSISKSINILNTSQRESLLINGITFSSNTDANEYICLLNSDYKLIIDENNGNPIKTYEWKHLKIIVENSTINEISITGDSHNIKLIVGNTEIGLDRDYYNMIFELSQELEITISDNVVEDMSFRLSNNYVLEIITRENSEPNEVQVEEILIRRVGEL